ncbi:MAG: ABC transporter permease [Clostridiales bacterium]|nr:ABC transporter permease [Clostridiales bacterium]
MNIFGRQERRMQTVADEFVAKVDAEARNSLIRLYAPMILFVVITIGFSLYDSHFFSTKNIVNMLGQMAVPLILATGLTFVLLIGSIDLSVEGVMGFVGSAISLLVINSRNSNNWGVWGVVIPIVIGILYGGITGILHVKLRIASFIITYATGIIISGIAVLLYKGQPATVKAQWMIDASATYFLGIPLITWIAIAFFLLGCAILNFTAFGRAVYAIGDNEAAARASGINVNRVTVLVFMLCGSAASLAGLVALVRLKLGQVSLGVDQMFPCITALVIGGTSLAGGKGGMLQTIVGILVYMELLNFLTIIGVSADYKKAIQGIIIIIAVALTLTRSRKTIAK